MAEWKFLLLIWTVVILETFGTVSADSTTCNQKVWCSDCITSHPDCAWCESTDYTGARCSTVEDLTTNLCRNITHPKNSGDFIQDNALRDGGADQDPIQLQPQHIRLKMKPGEKYYLDLKYKVADNLPIDMYFVLDFSATMASRIQDLATLTKNLTDGLASTYSNNIHIGFGSFMDKPVQPFTITVPKQLENPCILGGGTCERAYGYIHRSKLNKDIRTFVETIKNSSTSANFDPMEGGLDAILQASVCPEIVGWRNQSRRVLIHISDAGFHFAGDGKLAGIDYPNDGVCHMYPRPGHPNQYIYTQSEYLDYPSFGQIKYVLKKNNINAFFLASLNDIKTYKSLTDFIGPQADTEEMDTEGASNIISKIKDFYTALSSTVDIGAVDLPSDINVVAETKCNKSRLESTFDLSRESIHCEDLSKGLEVHINVSIQVNECPPDKTSKKMFKLIPSGLQESLLIEIEYICDCDCPNSSANDDTYCSMGNGTYECGVCRCNEGRSGEICQCNIEDESEQSIGEQNCKKNNETNSICEDRGSCKCGQCICSKNYDGKYCECDTSLCVAPGSSSKCTNKLQGDCSCGKCVCKEDYYGDYCECPPRSSCLGENGLECNGNGECVCGQCQCHQNYNGTYCQDCPRCRNCLRCGNDDQRQCVTCLDLNKGTVNASSTICALYCSGLNITQVDRFSKDDSPCDIIIADNTDCNLNYAIQCLNDTINLKYSKTRQCTNPPDPLLIAMPILGGIIGVGILLLAIWKLLTTFYDKIEYEKFEHEIKHPKWSKFESPLYQTATTSNENPAFKGNLE